MDAALYLRVSTDEQDVTNQLPALERMAAARGLNIVERFSETMSGTKKSRPALDALLKGARQGRYQVILVWAIDRLGRSMPAIVDTVIGLDSVGVSIVSHQEPWLDTGGPVRPLLLSIFAWVAQQERERLVERTKAGLSRARAAGKTLGRPKREVDLDAALRYRRDGLSMRETAFKLGVGVGTLHRALQSDDVPSSARARG
jgi:DNA invertase Pin-like site-specific DNA recombinase